jgi:hypothetical protein
LEVHVSQSAAFVLKNSRLNPFLFAEVGTELNGSTLTILSVLGRLGQDPWAAAAAWAKLPTAAVIGQLADSIGQMPLCPQALGDARLTASRLVQLLPARIGKPAPDGSAASGTSAMPPWAPLALFCGTLAFALAVNVLLTPQPAAVVTPPAAQTELH